MIADREKEIAEARRRFDIEALALKSFRETGQFTLAIPGYHRQQWKPTTESEAVAMAGHAAFVSMNTKPLPVSFSLEWIEVPEQHEYVGEGSK